MPVARPFGEHFDHFGGRAPLDHPIEREACADHGVVICGDGPMLLDDAVNKPAGDPFAFDEVVIERPDPGTGLARLKVLCAGAL